MSIQINKFSFKLLTVFRGTSSVRQKVFVYIGSHYTKNISESDFIKVLLLYGAGYL